MNVLNFGFGAMPFLKSEGPVSHLVQDNETHCGVAAGTLIATSEGARPVEDLIVGDMIRTFDNGPRAVLAILRHGPALSAIEDNCAAHTITVPAGTLGNARPMVMMPDQGIMVGSENARDSMGDPFAVVPVRALEGLCGIHRSAPHQQTEFFTLVFAQDEVVFADGGQLLHFAAPQAGETGILYDIKTAREARQMLTDLDVAELMLEDERNDTLTFGRMARVA